MNKTQVIRRGEGTKVVAEQANYQAILLAPVRPARVGHLFAAHPARRRPHFASASARLGGTYYRHPGAGAGRADAAPEELGEGDYICYPADQEHVFQALEPDTQAC